MSISKIRQGTVIDHIQAGKGIFLLKVLKLENASDSILLGMNLTSPRMGKKDILKIENTFFELQELHKIAVISPQATIALIKDYSVAEKAEVKMPEKIQGIFRCPSQNCITQFENIESSFNTLSAAEKILLECHFCQKQTPLTSALCQP